MPNPEPLKKRYRNVLPGIVQTKGTVHDNQSSITTIDRLRLPANDENANPGEPFQGKNGQAITQSLGNDRKPVKLGHTGEGNLERFNRNVEFATAIRAQRAFELKKQNAGTKPNPSLPQKRFLLSLPTSPLKDALPYNIRKSFDILQRLKKTRLGQEVAKSFGKKTPAERIQRLNTYLALDDLEDVEFINIDPSARISTTTGTRNLNKEVNPLLKVPSSSRNTINFWMSLRPDPGVLNHSDAISIAVEIYTNTSYVMLKNMTDQNDYVRALEELKKN